MTYVKFSEKDNESGPKSLGAPIRGGEEPPSLQIKA